MTNILKNKAFILSSVIFFELWLLLIIPTLFWYLIIVLVLTLILGLKFYCQLNWRKSPECVHFLILPTFFISGSAFFIFTSLNRVFQAFFITGISVVIYFLARTIDFTKERKKPMLLSTRNFFFSITFFTVFLISVILINLQFFLSIGLPLVLVSLFTIIFLLTFSLVWQNRMLSVESLIYITAISFIEVEIVLATSFWNINYPPNVFKSSFGIWGIPLVALIITVIYYFLWGLSFHKLKGSLTKSIILEYSIISGVILLILLFTSKWLPYV